ncbi:MAG: bifunctional 4-hydroxy-2-oxoglutarate aldolase/2-dehydro-3-deoxy-phosphogluconate aldolase [Christensenellaceae bacterium]|jgi:2-dehydro-3-deoxyphosphogluconate aldolase/(4S)-4-hydroxy-2-oxoglutarate aldolase|nr:bifunctional 4-hydroxy-2-oxoglutarate aldolase/2-dehydro-3-deoxy-phosphogluconate aldolase [Christensenellaceae bacterium]
MNNINEQVAKHKIIPVITLHSADDAAPLADALIDGGLPVGEITFRTDAAEESIRRIVKACPDMLVGAGTVMNTEQAERAFGAGARFIVTAGFSHTVTKWCVGKGLPIFPGACTPSELMWLMEYDLHVAKFFPAAQFGGVATIKALAAPFPNMRFLPTGGVSEKNILEYLAFPKIIACGGSWMVKPELIAERKFDAITALTQTAVKLVNP